MKKLLIIGIFTCFFYLFYFSSPKHNIDKLGFRDAPNDFTDISVQDIKNRDVNLPVPSPAVASNQTNASAQNIAIYGNNTLRDWYKVDKSLRELSESVAAFVSGDSLRFDKSRKVYKPLKLETLGDNYSLAESADFKKQKVLSYCSGSLVSPYLVLTAGHCIEYNPKDPYYYKNTYIVFGWKQYAQGRYSSTFSPRQVYNINRVLIRKLTRGGINYGEDYALVELDRRVSGIDPLPIDRTGEFLVKGNKVFTIGYPLGMSVKITDPADAEIKRVGKNKFITNLDTFGGSSGAPVFDSYTRRITGVHVTGNAVNMFYRTDQPLTISFETSNKVRGKAYTRKDNPSSMVISADVLPYVLSMFKKGNAVVDMSNKTIMLPAGSKVYNNTFLFKVALKNNVVQPGSGKFIHYEKFDGIGSGETRINSVIEALVPLTENEKRICYSLESKMRANRPIVDPNLMMLYKMLRCNKSRGI